MVLAGFLPTFLIARLLVARFPGLFLHIRGTHVHHFIYGFFVLAIIGFISILSERGRRIQAFVYGVGLALAFDEFGMWMHLTNNYNIDTSEDALAWIFAFLIFLRLRHWHDPPSHPAHEAASPRSLSIAAELKILYYMTVAKIYYAQWGVAKR